MIDALVTGRSLPALQAALDLAEVGLQVAIAGFSGLEGSEAEYERDPDGEIAAFVARITRPIEGGTSGGDASRADASLRGASVTDAPNRVGGSQRKPPMLRDLAGEWAPQPEMEVLGIPAVPIAAEVIRLIGGGAATRAYLDRLKPLLTIGKTRELGRLVRSRMGGAVLERLVEPQVFERYGVGADEVDVAIAAPGLNEAVSRAGALGAGVLAYSDRNVARETWLQPVGGYEVLRADALHKLELYGVRLLDSPVVELGESTEGWVAVLEDGTRLDARAVLADQGRSPRGVEWLAPIVQGVLPRYSRLYVEIDIDRPAWLQSGCSALSSTEGWVVRFDTPVSGEGAIVRLSSGVFEASQPVTHAEDLSRHGVRLFAAMFEDAPRDGEEWTVRSAQQGAKPHATLEERDAAAVALEAAVFARDTVLPVGRALHGDDLGAAIEWAHRGAVSLRRKLLGLSPEN